MARKLLQINVTANIGSTGRLAEELGQVAQSLGWESYIAYGREMRPSKSHLIRIGNKFDNYLHVIKTRLFDRHNFGSYFATKKLVRNIQKIKPDIIQLHNIHGYYLNIKVFYNFLSQSDIPVVWSLHDCWTMTGHCAHFVMAGCEKWKSECYDCPLTRSYPKSLFIDNSRKNYREKKSLFTLPKNITVVSASEWLGSIIRESYLSKYPLHIIPNGINLDVFYPRNDTCHIRKKYGLVNKFVLMGIGTMWDDNKGLSDYYELRKVLSNKYEILLVGMTQKQIANLPDGITGITRTNNIDELAMLYSAADVITSFSYMEAFGLTPIEGFACGTPAIVYNCTSSPELITPDIGLVVKGGNIAEIKKAVEEISRNGKQYYSKACRQRAELMYRKEDRFGDYIKLYEELISNKFN